MIVVVSSQSDQVNSIQSICKHLNIKFYHMKESDLD